MEESAARLSDPAFPRAAQSHRALPRPRPIRSRATAPAAPSARCAAPRAPSSSRPAKASSPGATTPASAPSAGAASKAARNTRSRKATPSTRSRSKRTRRRFIVTQGELKKSYTVARTSARAEARRRIVRRLQTAVVRAYARTASSASTPPGGRTMIALETLRQKLGNRRTLGGEPRHALAQPRFPQRPPCCNGNERMRRALHHHHRLPVARRHEGFRLEYHWDLEGRLLGLPFMIAGNTPNREHLRSLRSRRLDRARNSRGILHRVHGPRIRAAAAAQGR